MHFTKKTVAEKRSDLIKGLQSKKLLRFPGAYNPLCAKLIAVIGFDGVYVSGGVMSNDLGLPDIGLTSLEQVSYRSSQIARVTDLPTIVDIDTGFGNCKKTIEVFESKGLAGCHLEDQVAEKRCGHLDNKELISKEEMVKKIKECVKSRKDKNFLIIARTDANTVEGLYKTIDRIKSYESAGADMIFPEALVSLDGYKKIAQESSVPILANITEFGKTPLFSKKELHNAGVSMVLYPLTAFRAMSKAAEKIYKELSSSESQEHMLGEMQTRDELYDYLSYHKYEKEMDDILNKKDE